MEETSTLSIQDGSNELLPPKDNVKVGRAVFQLLEQILQYKADQGLPAKWHRCYELSKGKHWRKETRKATLVTANLLFTHRQRTVAMLTDNNPTFNATQSGELPRRRSKRSTSCAIPPPTGGPRPSSRTSSRRP